MVLEANRELLEKEQEATGREDRWLLETRLSGETSAVPRHTTFSRRGAFRVMKSGNPKDHRETVHIDPFHSCTLSHLSPMQSIALNVAETIELPYSDELFITARNNRIIVLHYTLGAMCRWAE
jgi:hypothetical protein